MAQPRPATDTKPPHGRTAARRPLPCRVRRGGRTPDAGTPPPASLSRGPLSAGPFALSFTSAEGKDRGTEGSQHRRAQGGHHYPQVRGGFRAGPDEAVRTGG